MRTPRTLLGAIGAVALISGCGTDHGNPVPIAPVSNPTASPTATASLAPGATPSPTPMPTPTAVAAPPGSSIQSFCSLTNNSLASNQYPPVPGTYTLFEDEGEFTGTSYSQVFGEYEPVVLTSPSPGPTIAPTATPIPTPVSSASPSYVYYVYSGGYSVPGYTQTPGPSASPGTASLNVSATTGCFLFIQEVQPTPAPDPSESPYNAVAIGVPFDLFSEENGGVNVSAYGSVGLISTFGFTSLTTSGGGVGTFTLDNGVVGSFSVGGQQTFTEDKLRRAKAFYHNRFRKT